MGETQSLSNTDYMMYSKFSAQQNEKTFTQSNKESLYTNRLSSVESYSSLNTRCDTPLRQRLSFEDKLYIYNPCIVENPQITLDIQILHESKPITKEKPTSYRNDYYHKLIYKNILTSRKEKIHNSIFIFDWDDTLFPTHFLAPEGYYDENAILQNNSLKRMNITEQLVHSLLSKALAKGLVYIVTNSSAGWVEYSAEKYYPSIVHMLKYINIISARTEYEYLHPGDPFHWKYLAFKKIKDTLNDKMLTNLIVMGDSIIEIKAGEQIAKLFETCYIKTIKLKPSPSLDEINKQLKLVDESFMKIYSPGKNLNVKVVNRNSC